MLTKEGGRGGGTEGEGREKREGGSEGGSTTINLIPFYIPHLHPSPQKLMTCFVCVRGGERERI